MNKILIVFLTFILSSFSALADFTPLEEKVVELRNVLSNNKTIKKSELEDSLLSIRSKTSLIKNDIARTDLTGDVDILLKKYVTSNKKDYVKSKEVDYWLQHIIDDLSMFVKMGITE